MEKTINQIKEVLEKIGKLSTKDQLLLENMCIDLEFIYTKYDKKINPKYYKKISINKLTILFYNSGINILLTDESDEKVFWEIVKPIIKHDLYKCVKLRKNKDFDLTTICTSKSLPKVKTWFESNHADYDVLSLFFVVQDLDKCLEKEIEKIENNKR